MEAQAGIELASQAPETSSFAIFWLIEYKKLPINKL